MKLLLASDLHYCKDLAREIAVNQDRLPSGTYNHQVDGKLYWHNFMLVDDGEALLDGLVHHLHAVAPDRLVFMGDIVNTNWEENVAAVAARVTALDCPLRMVTGNHDIYLGDPASRLQDALAPNTYITDLRHEIVDGLGLIYLDLFAIHRDGTYHKWIDPSGIERVDYHPDAIAGAQELLAAHPTTPWLVLGHFPMVAPDARIDQPGRKMGRRWPGGTPLAAHLQQPDNLLGIICGHQHFAHFQPFAHGFHWTLPPLVEYPCAAAVIEWDGTTLRGRLLEINPAMTARSLAPRQEDWTAGDASDRAFTWPRA